jgi:hypothetical protein
VNGLEVRPKRGASPTDLVPIVIYLDDGNGRRRTARLVFDNESGTGDIPADRTTAVLTPSAARSLYESLRSIFGPDLDAQDLRIIKAIDGPVEAYMCDACGTFTNRAPSDVERPCSGCLGTKFHKALEPPQTDWLG